MSFRKPDGPLTVQVPSAAEDRPSWPGVAAIAVLGFAVGVAWPRLAGVRLGPSVPDGPSASASGEPTGPAPSSAPAGSSVAVPAVPAALPVPAASPAPTATATAPVAAGPAHVSVGRGAIFACKTPEGESLKGSECGALAGLDALVQPRLQRLAECPDAASASGTLHLVVHADFGRDTLTADLGHEKGVASPAPLLACAKSALSSATLKGLTHDNARYSVAYSVRFTGGPGSGAAGGANAAPQESSAAAAADATAQVEWNVGIVRDAPHTSGKVVARLARGTALRVGAPKDGWYPVQYGDGFANSGWLFHGAIGR